MMTLLPGDFGFYLGLRRCGDPQIR